MEIHIYSPNHVQLIKPTENCNLFGGGGGGYLIPNAVTLALGHLAIPYTLSSGDCLTATDSWKCWGIYIAGKKPKQRHCL